MGHGASLASEIEPSCDQTYNPHDPKHAQYLVKLLHPLPEMADMREFILRISYESIDFRDATNEDPLLQFPYQSILCWGHNHSMFQFRVSSKTLNRQNIDEHHDSVSIAVLTDKGAEIEARVMKTVRVLMTDITKRAVSKEDFKHLLEVLIDPNTEVLVPDWIKTLEQFSQGRAFLAEQAVTLLHHIAPQATFEHLELACFLYHHILEPESFQLIINTFEDDAQRENVIHRLGLDSERHKHDPVHFSTHYRQPSMINSRVLFESGMDPVLLHASSSVSSTSVPAVVHEKNN